MEKTYNLIFDSENNLISEEYCALRKSYKIKLRFLDNEGNYSERQEIYSGLEKESLAFKLVSILKDRDVPDNNFPAKTFNISLGYVEMEFNNNLDPLSYKETIIESDYKKEKDFFYDNGNFCRSYYLCDIIKSWDVSEKF